MCRILGVLVLMAMLIPRPSSALQLHWGSGATTLSFTQATRCTLVVQADSSEQRLPAEWRLLWVADSSTDINPVPIDSQLACEADMAQVSAVDEPANAADSAAHLRTIHFCSEDGPASTIAQYLLDLPAESRGRLEVVALDPGDSTQVTESNEVTFNGGAWGAYPSVILHASSARFAEELAVTAVGTGLNAVHSVSISSPVGPWRVGLSILSQSDASFTASATLAANIPACVLEAVGAEGAIAAAPLMANSSYGASEALWAPSVMAETLGVAAGGSAWVSMQPKDFAFVRALSKFHLIYIRRRMIAETDNTEKNFGHAWSTDLSTWHWESLPSDTSVLDVSGGTWDNYHVWAPHVVAKDGRFWMFYTGVEQWSRSDQHHQRIGVSTSFDLETWDRNPPILTVFDIPWAKRAPPILRDHGSQQLRDPFVMEDPSRPGGWLMYFVAMDSSTAPAMAVGVARSNGDFFNWTPDEHPMRSTDSSAHHGFRVESPHVFKHGDRQWLFMTPGDLHGLPDQVPPYNPASFVVSDSAGDPTDTLATSWSAPESLYYYPDRFNPDPHLQYWHGSEHLIVGDHEYLAAYDDHVDGIVIGEMNWYGPRDFIVGSASAANLAVDGAAGFQTNTAGLRLIGALPARSSVRMELSLPSAMAVRLTIFDVLGRRVRTVLERDLPAGTTAAAWDGRDVAGGSVRSGLYFVRMSCAAGERRAKVMLLR